MVTKNKDEICLASVISLKASLITSITAVRSKMSCYPAFKQVSEGTSLRYALLCDNITDRFYTLRLEKDSITLILNSTSSPTYFLREAITRILSISMALSEDYAIDFYGLIPHMIFVLADKCAEPRQIDVPNFNRESDILLSRRIVGLLSLNDALRKESEELNHNLISVLSKLIIYKYSKGLKPELLAAELGIQKQSVFNAMTLLKSQGYQMLNTSGKALDLVGI